MLTQPMTEDRPASTSRYFVAESDRHKNRIDELETVKVNTRPGQGAADLWRSGSCPLSGSRGLAYVQGSVPERDSLRSRSWPLIFESIIAPSISYHQHQVDINLDALPLPTSLVRSLSIIGCAWCRRTAFAFRSVAACLCTGAVHE